MLVSRSCNGAVRLFADQSIGAYMSMSKPCISCLGRSWANVRIKPNTLPEDQLPREEPVLGQDEGKHPITKATNLLEPEAPSGACCSNDITASVTSILAFNPGLVGISTAISQVFCSKKRVRPERSCACEGAPKEETVVWHCQDTSYRSSFCSATT